MRRNVLFFLMLVVMWSCTSDSYEGYRDVYVFDRFETGPVRVFAEGQELNDPALAGRFTTEMSTTFYAPGLFSDDNVSQSRVIFTSLNRAILEHADTSVATHVIRVQDRLYFEMADTLYSFQSPIQMQNTLELFRPQTQVSMDLSTRYPFQFSLYMYGYLRCIYGVQKGAEIRLPYMSVLEKQCRFGQEYAWGGYCSQRSFVNMNNMFNTNYLGGLSSNLTDRDTVVVQENFVVFRRK